MAAVGAAVALLARLESALGDRLIGFELMSAPSLALSRGTSRRCPIRCPATRGTRWCRPTTAPPTSPLAALARGARLAAARDGVARDAVIAQSGEQAAELWALRENIAEAQRREGPNIKHDISLPVSAIPRFLDEAAAALTAAFPGSRLVVFGHLGDGNLHYNLAAPEGVAADAFLANAARANRIVHDLRRRAWRQHQRRARHRPVEARRARPLQERASSSS